MRARDAATVVVRTKRQPRALRHLLVVDRPDAPTRSTLAIAAVLAGGRGSRLASGKPCARLASRPLISYPLAAAAAAGLEAMVLAKRDSRLPRLRCTTIEEPDTPRHPLCGIVTALEHGGGRPVVVVACDMPFVTGRLLAWLAALDGAVVPLLAGGLQPLAARYEPAHLPILRRALKEGQALREAAAMLRPRIVSQRELRRFGDPARLLFNVNTVSDLELAERWLVA